MSRMIGIVTITFKLGIQNIIQTATEVTMLYQNIVLPNKSFTLHSPHFKEACSYYI